MPPLTPQGLKIIEYVAQRHSVSTGAVLTVLDALARGNGTVAQFQHPELGGVGQWSHDGTIMTGEIGNDALKSKVDGICTELAELLHRAESGARAGARTIEMQEQSAGSALGEFSLFVRMSDDPAEEWLSGDFGPLSASGSQNGVSYAYSRASGKLAVKRGDQIVVYDASGRDITGIAQRNPDGTLCFTSSNGRITLAELRVISKTGGPVPGPAPVNERDRLIEAWTNGIKRRSSSAEDVFQKLERLADLKSRGIISEDEFTSKKRELLERI